jgi:hypothetical protein
VVAVAPPGRQAVSLCVSGDVLQTDVCRDDFAGALTMKVQRGSASSDHTLAVEDDGWSEEAQRLLDELCVDLGFCLPPEEQQRLLQEASSMSVDAFIDAVFIAEGMDPYLYKQLRRGVRDRVQRWLPVMTQEPEDWQTDN